MRDRVVGHESRLFERRIRLAPGAVVVPQLMPRKRLQHHVDGHAPPYLVPPLRCFRNLRDVAPVFMHRVIIAARDVHKIQVLPHVIQVAVFRLVDPHRPLRRIEFPNHRDRRPHVRDDRRGLLGRIRLRLGRLRPPGVARRVNAHRAVQPAERRKIPHDLVGTFPHRQRRMVRHLRHPGPQCFRRTLLERQRHHALHAQGVQPVQLRPVAAPHQVHPRFRHGPQSRVTLGQLVESQRKQPLAIFGQETVVFRRTRPANQGSKHHG